MILQSDNGNRFYGKYTYVWTEVMVSGEDFSLMAAARSDPYPGTTCDPYPMIHTPLEDMIHTYDPYPWSIPQ